MRNDYEQGHRTSERPRHDDDRRDRENDRRAFGWDRNRGQRDRHDEEDSRRSYGRRRDERSRRDERDFGPDDDREGMPRNETERLIASHKVEGTPVYDRNGKNLGTICTLMVDKFSGQTAYAVLRGRGMIGLVDRYYPIRWQELTYDNRAHGYGVDFDEDDLKHRPGFDRDGKRIGHRKERSRDDRDSSWW